MIAKVQYNDFVGTAAADISDFYANSIDDYIKSLSDRYDTTRFHCVGCEFLLTSKSEITLVFYCNDLRDKTLVPFSFNKTFELGELCVIFKRLNVIIGQGLQDIPQPECETIFLD